MSNEINKEEWIVALKEATAVLGAPAGWITRAEYQKTFGVSKARACAELNSMLSAKTAEKKDFQVRNSTGGMRTVPYYRIKSKAC